MSTMMKLSLWLNVAVLVPVCVGLLADHASMRGAFGERTPARGILLSVYLSILGVSVLLVLLGDPRPAAALLLVQIVYKLTTPLTVGTLANPVVRSNLAIAAFHTVTLWQLGWPLAK
jgi:hypothetical protein